MRSLGTNSGVGGSEAAVECGTDVDEEDEEDGREEERGGAEDEIEEVLGREGEWTRHAEELKGAFQNANASL